MAPKGKPYRPDYISRKMFDIYQDRLDLRVQRIQEDYRADVAALLARINSLEARFTEMADLFHN